MSSTCFTTAARGDSINLFHAESEDGVVFKTTGSLMRLTGSMRGAFFFPSIVVSGKQLFMVWQGERGELHRPALLHEIIQLRQVLELQETDNPRAPGNNVAPSMMIHDNTLYVVFQNNDEKNWAIKMIRGVDPGGSWDEKPLIASATVANCYSPLGRVRRRRHHGSLVRHQVRRNAHLRQEVLAP